MKIALFSDVHANLPALAAFFKDLDTRKPDAIYCLGDLVGYHIWPNEVINEITSRGIPTIAGNHDAKVSRLSDAERTASSGKNYAYSLIGENQRNYLATLPAHIRLEFQLPQGPLTILLVHGSPASNDEYLLENKPEAEFLDVFRKAGADILCFGHSHKPHYRILNDNAAGPSMPPTPGTRPASTPSTPAPSENPKTAIPGAATSFSPFRPTPASMSSLSASTTKSNYPPAPSKQAHYQRNSPTCSAKHTSRKFDSIKKHP